MAVNILALLAGMVIYAYFSDCNPIQMKRIAKTDEYFPFFVVHYLSKFPGIAGLHVSSVYAGSLSTISSGHDLIRTEFRKTVWPRLGSISASVVTNSDVGDNVLLVTLWW